MPSVNSKTIRVYYRGGKYDVPEEFATRLHPGGKHILLRYKDSDITKIFEKTQHTVDAVVMLKSWAAGNVDYGIPMKTDAELDSGDHGESGDRKEDEKTKGWNRVAVAFGIASIVAAVGLRKH